MTKTFVGGAQWGSEGKGAIVGYLAKKGSYTAAVAAFPPSTGHTFIDDDGFKVVTMMLPISVVSPTVTSIFIGPGAILDVGVLRREIQECRRYMGGKKVWVHEHAAIVFPEHSAAEREAGLTKIGSTAKGGMAAQIEKMARNQHMPNIARSYATAHSASINDGDIEVVSAREYLWRMQEHEHVMIEGSQGFGLSMHHGFYPYCVARDTTPFAVLSDCGVPMSWFPDIEFVWVLRTYPIRVNNRDGSSGPCYPDQHETSFDHLNRDVELTTVTKLPRRIFTFSPEQIEHLHAQCGNFRTTYALTFGDYMETREDLQEVIDTICYAAGMGNGSVAMVCFGPRMADIVDRDKCAGTEDFLNEIDIAFAATIAKSTPE